MERPIPKIRTFERCFAENRLIWTCESAEDADRFTRDVIAMYETPPAILYVAAHDGGCEGHSLPLLAFTNRETAMAWAAAQSESYDITEVPIYPDVPKTQWFRLEPERR
jgi:hypothetical protein